MSTVAYLASPYSHPDPDVRQQRFVAACRAAARLMREEGVVVLSPISHGHSVAEHGELPAMAHDFWMRQCMPVLTRCDEVVVLMLDGWEESRGVREEIAQAQLLDIPVRYVEA